jgi:hypothetical protein
LAKAAAPFVGPTERSADRQTGKTEFRVQGWAEIEVVGHPDFGDDKVGRVARQTWKERDLGDDLGPAPLTFGALASVAQYVAGAEGSVEWMTRFS